jgi:5-methylcytosine-specific restriction endonuclease McrA
VVIVPVRKICTRCRLEKDIDCFYKQGSGHASRCKSCLNEVKKIYRQQHPKARKERVWVKEDYASFRRKSNARNKKYRESHKEEIRQYYKNLDRDKINARQRELRKNNPGRDNIYHNRWRESHIETSRNIVRRRRAKLLEIVSTLTNEEWNKILEDWNYCCVKCGTDKNITMDHLIPVAKNGHHAWYNVLPLCKSCNSKKGTKDFVEFFGGFPQMICPNCGGELQVSEGCLNCSCGYSRCS